MRNLGSSQISLRIILLESERSFRVLKIRGINLWHSTHHVNGLVSAKRRANLQNLCQLLRRIIATPLRLGFSSVAVVIFV
jgi:hypothetical protein